LQQSNNGLGFVSIGSAGLPPAELTAKRAGDVDHERAHKQTSFSTRRGTYLACHDSVVVRHGLEYRSSAVPLAGMNLHRSCGLCTLTADALIEFIDALNMGAVVTD
jgi:hypothetical protein